MATCPICKNHDLDRIYSTRNTPLLRCKECGLAFFDMEKESPPDYWSEGSSSRNLDIYQNNSVRRDLSTSYDRYLKEIKDEIGKVKFVDFGCGIGNFLAHAEDRGWQGIGVEKSSRAINVARSRGLKVFSLSQWKRSFNDIPQKGRKEDLVQFVRNSGCLVMLDVIEHFRDILDDLYVATKPFSRDSGLFIETPDYNFPFRRLSLLVNRVSSGKFNPARYFFYIDHRYYFNASNLELILEKFGYSKIAGNRTTTSPAKVVKKLKKINQAGWPVPQLAKIILYLANLLGGNKLIYTGLKTGECQTNAHLA